MFFVALNSYFTPISIVGSFLLLALFVIAGFMVGRMVRSKPVNQPFPRPISDHEQLWQSLLPYENLGSGGDQEKLVVYTMAHINSRKIRKDILSCDNGRESWVSDIIRETTLPSFNLQYERELSLSDYQIQKVTEKVLLSL